MKTYYFELANGTRISIKAENETDARQKARAAQDGGQNGTDWGRVAGLAGRAGAEGLVEGAGTLASLPVDAGYNLFAAGQNALNYMAPDYVGPAEYGMPATNAVVGAGQALGNALGLPTPETDNEKLYSAIGKGAVSFLPSMGVGAGLNAVGRVAQGVSGLERVGRAVQGTGDILRAAPVTQAVGGAAAGGASEYTMQETGDPYAAAIAGIAAGSSASAVPAAAGLTRATLRPLYPSGRDQIVGDILNMQARNPDAAIQAMQNAPQYVPGSQPLAGVASRDPGLINLQRGAERADTRKILTDNIEQANNARHQALRGMTLTPEQADARWTARTAKADVDTAALFDTPAMQRARVSAKPIFTAMSAIRQDARTAARLPVQEALSFAQREIMKFARRDKKTGDIVVNPGVLYSIRQNIAQAMKGDIRPSDLPNIKLGGKTMQSVISAIDDQIETAAPGFKAYMDDLAQSAKQIEQGTLGGEAYRAGISRGPGGVTINEPFLNQATLTKAYEKVAPKLDPRQRQTFDAVIADLNRSMQVNSPSIRATGSDTVQNLSVAALIGRVAGGGAIDSIIGEGAVQLLGKLGRLGSAGTPATVDRLVEAMADPRLAAALMRKATPGNIKYANSIINQLVQGAGSAARTSAANSQTHKGMNITFGPDGTWKRN